MVGFLVGGLLRNSTKVGDDLIDLLDGNIPMKAEYKTGKEIQIQLAKAVALENNRISITAAQKAGRATKTTGTGPGIGPGSEFGSELVNAQLSRQLFPQVSPDLPAPEPAKKTQKQRLLVGEHGEVDVGPMKLQNRK
jgi:hypothetical protein